MEFKDAREQIGARCARSQELRRGNTERAITNLLNAPVATEYNPLPRIFSRAKKMSRSFTDHSTALVPIETHLYMSPELHLEERPVDIGLLLEALIYYERVFFSVSSQPQLAAVLRWFEESGELTLFTSLLKDGTLSYYDYAFSLMPTLYGPTGHWNVMILTSDEDRRVSTFEERMLEHASIKAAIPDAARRHQVRRALLDHVYEAKSPAYERAVENAREDFRKADRVAATLQALVDELYRVRLNDAQPPKVLAKITPALDSKSSQIRVNIKFDVLSRLIRSRYRIEANSVLTAACTSNRFLWSAALKSYDLYLGSPLARIVGDKLDESGKVITRSRSIIEGLQEEVDFPDIRSLVNSKNLTLKSIIDIRRKARRFRRWLQTESDRDRNAIHAYHNEVGREIKIIAEGRKVLRLFGVIGGGAAGTLIASHPALGPVESSLLGGGITGISGYVADLASKLGTDWRPVVFGDWLSERTSRGTRG